MSERVISALKEIREARIRYPIPQQITTPEEEVSVDIRRPKKWNNIYKGKL
jgi:hypothetical protein